MSKLAEPSLDRPIFVVGHPRSGTTLLASMLGRHPEIAATPETLYLTQTRFQVSPVLRAGPEAIAQRIDDTALRFIVGDPAALIADLRLVQPTEKTLFSILLELFRKERAKPRVLEKSPLHLRHIGELLAWFPDARILWIVRDGRACVASLRRVTWAPHDPIVLARQWVRNMAFARSCDAPGSVLRVSFEGLVSDPQQEMGRVQDFLQVPRSANVFDHTRKVETVKPVENEWKANVGHPLQLGRLNAWQEELSPDVIGTVSAVMNPTLRRLGYDTMPLPAQLKGVAAMEAVRSTVLYNRASVGAMRLGYPWAMRMLEAWKPRSERKPRYWQVSEDRGR